MALAIILRLQCGQGELPRFNGMTMRPDLDPFEPVGPIAARPDLDADGMRAA